MTILVVDGPDKAFAVRTLRPRARIVNQVNHRPGRPAHPLA
ncbi:hypothetical protein [Endobacter medicaginis]|nr:hypothetical protein [Endobacter medicaginis]